MNPYSTLRVMQPELVLHQVIQKCDLMAGRIGAATFILIFAATYCALLNYLGIALGIAFAWLPAFAAAWAAAHASAFILGALLRFCVLLRFWLALR